jgi:hypothetical protein
VRVSLLKEEGTDAASQATRIKKELIKVQ